ncbi:MAG: hypothetical protein NWE93_02080 [Candidatus Bathyarchaeota archaeon]|nr:hypothetical protein [Candidatus Bathyarchaeota archaeon]
MSGTSVAVSEATRLGEIQFPEFTAKLITDVFDALISANIRQTQAYVELLQAVSKSVSEYVNETKDDISGEMILQFLSKVLPDAEDKSGTKVRVGATLSSTEAETLNKALTVPEVQESPGIAAAAISDQTALDAILMAVAKRIAADKYTLLKEMVKMGVLRLVVEHGVIETKLTFTTYGSTFYESTKSNYNSKAFSVRASAKTGGLASLWVKASASTSFTSLNVSTAKESNRDISGSSVQIYGHVQIDFKTDYQPMTS